VSDAIRLTAVLTHPVQYVAPWFRHIAARCPEIDLTVVYGVRPDATQQGAGFGEPFLWDSPLTDGYRTRVVRPAASGERVDAASFWGLDVRGIGAAVRDTRPEVVLIPGWHSVTLVRALASSIRHRTPVLYRGDTHGGPRSRVRHAVWSARTWGLLRLFDGYLSVGQRTRTHLSRFGCPASRVFDVPHCVDNAFFAAAAALHQAPDSRAAARRCLGVGADDFVALFVGKLAPPKRPHDVIRALARVPGRRSALMVGAGALSSACRAEAERLGVPAAWTGFLNQSDLGRAYAAADCLVLPSEGETWGLVVNEALATGLPCVVSERVGCAPDLVTPGATGEVYTPDDEAALAQALERIRARGSAGHDWAPACRARVARYSFEHATAGLLAAARAVRRRR